MTIRICHIISDLNTGGAERSLVNLVASLDPARFTSDVVSLVEPGPMAQPLAELDIPVTSLSMRRGRPSVGGMITLVGHLRRTRPAILQTWLYHSDLIGTVASWFTRPDRLVWNLRCSDMTRGRGDIAIRWIVRALAFLSNQPDAIIVNSRRGKLFHQAAGYRPKMWVHIPNGVDVNRFRPRPAERASLRAKLGLDPNALVIGSVARFHPMKGWETFFHAAAQFSQRHNDVRFVLSGDTGISRENEPLQHLIESLDLGGRVVLLGARPDIENIYPVFDILALSSAYGEGFPNVLIEAMACGVPCVATDVGDSRDIVGDFGVIVPPSSPEALASGWESMLAPPSDIADRARAHVIRLYSLDQMRSRYEETYESLVGRRA